MKIFRSTVALGVAKKVYDEARKPQNQRRIKDAVASIKARRGGGGTGAKGGR